MRAEIKVLPKINTVQNNSTVLVRTYFQSLQYFKNNPLNHINALTNNLTQFATFQGRKIRV